MWLRGLGSAAARWKGLSGYCAASWRCRCSALSPTMATVSKGATSVHHMSALARLEGGAEPLESVATLRRLCEEGKLNEVVEVVGRMAEQGLEVDATLSRLVEECVRLGSLRHGRRVHELVASTGLQLDVYSQTGLNRLVTSAERWQDTNAIALHNGSAQVQRHSDGHAHAGAFPRGAFPGTGAERMPTRSWQATWNVMQPTVAKVPPIWPYPAADGRVPQLPRLHPWDTSSAALGRPSPITDGRPQPHPSRLHPWNTPNGATGRPPPCAPGRLQVRPPRLPPVDGSPSRIRSEPSSELPVRLQPGPYARSFVYNKKHPEIVQRVFSEEDMTSVCWSNSKRGQDEADMILADPFWTPESHDDHVQFKMRKILEEVFEPDFLPCSHGFRPGFSQLTCLKQVRRDFQGTVWFVGADLSKHLSTLRHPVILGLVKKKVHDPQFLALVQKGLKWEKLTTTITSGASAEALKTCAPMLINIALHDLDKFCMRLKKIVDRGKLIDGRLMSWRTIETATQAPFESKEDDKPPRFQAAKVLQDTYSRRIHYVRFGNEILSGVVGPHALAKRLVELIIRFLKLRLHLHLTEDDFEITRAKGEKVPFLGYLIGRNPDFGEKLVHYEDGEKRVDKVFKPGKLVLVVDKAKVIRRLSEKGFCTKGGEPRPNFRYFQMPQSESVYRVGQILKGLADYYNLSESKKKAVLYFNWIVRSSLAKTFAAKFKLRSQRKVYKRGTRDLSRPIARQSGSRKKNTYVPDSERPDFRKGKYQGRQMTGLPFTRLRQIPKADTKPLPKSWTPRVR